MGIPTCGGTWGGLTSNGDYNDGGVFCWVHDVKACRDAIIALSKCFITDEMTAIFWESKV